jgi:hypothetical protein
VSSACLGSPPPACFKSHESPQMDGTLPGKDSLGPFHRPVHVARMPWAWVRAPHAGLPFLWPPSLPSAPQAHLKCAGSLLAVHLGLTGSGSIANVAERNLSGADCLSPCSLAGLAASHAAGQPLPPSSAATDLMAISMTATGVTGRPTASRGRSLVGAVETLALCPLPRVPGTGWVGAAHVCWCYSLAEPVPFGNLRASVFLLKATVSHLACTCRPLSWTLLRPFQLHLSIMTGTTATALATWLVLGSSAKRIEF